MKSTLEKEVQFLKLYAAVATLAFVVFLVSAFTFQTQKQKFEEIDVERINVVEKDGKLKMVISNKERQHPGIMDGKNIQRHGRPRPPGILFFNEIGDVQVLNGFSIQVDHEKPLKRFNAARARAFTGLKPGVNESRGVVNS